MNHAALSVELDAISYSVVEGGTVSITAVLSAPGTIGVAVEFATVAGSAIGMLQLLRII